LFDAILLRPFPNYVFFSLDFLTKPKRKLTSSSSSATTTKNIQSQLLTWVDKKNDSNDVIVLDDGSPFSGKFL